MTLRPPDWPKLVAGLLCLHAWAIAAAGETVDASPRSTSFTLEPGQSRPCLLGDLKAGQTLSLLLSLEQASPGPGDRVTAELAGPGIKPIRKEMYAGDPDWYLTFRPASDGRVAVTLIRGNDSGRAALSVRVQWRQLPLAESERVAIEAEPNDRWQEANPLQLGRDVYGTADDADYLANTKEGKCGLDWFRFEVEGAEPILVYFQLDLLDRDVSANLRVYTVDHKSAGTTLYLTGKDPMEIVHDRERERYSKHISRTFTRGTYYLEVNANHPDYILRTRVLPVPPYNEPAQAVEAGMHYIMNVGDAWFAQVPRAGNIFIRSDNIHDTGTRCTACHASSFSTEANLAAHRNGYPIRSKSDFQYVIGPDRQLDDAAVRRRRPLLAAVHRDPASGPGRAGRNPGRLRARGVRPAEPDRRAVRSVPQGRLGKPPRPASGRAECRHSHWTASSDSPGATGGS